MFGLGGPDRLVGGPGVDILRGNAAADSLYGGEDGDSMIGGAGRDHVYGGPGDDSISTIKDNAVDFVNCGPGFDYYDQSLGVGAPDQNDIYVNCEIEIS